MATVALGVLNLASMHGQPIVTPAPPTACRASPCHSVNYLPPSIGQWLLAVAVVTPLLLAARYPLLGWRIGRSRCCSPRWYLKVEEAGRKSGATAGAAGGVLPGRGSLWAAGAVVDVGAEPHPLVAVAGENRTGLWPVHRRHRVHRWDDRVGQHRFPMAYPAGSGRQTERADVERARRAVLERARIARGCTA
jgi:hypothetical protein